MKNNKFLKFTLFILLFALMGLAVMLLWNALIPQIIEWSAIDYLQALGLIVLSRLLFGGWGGLKHRTRNNFTERNNQLKGMTKMQKREFILKHYQDTNGCNKE
ncbi:MAG: hypothetical protein R3Y49_08185 [Rikenellaceae bacterium]